MDSEDIDIKVGSLGYTCGRERKSSSDFLGLSKRSGLKHGDVISFGKSPQAWLPSPEKNRSKSVTQRNTTRTADGELVSGVEGCSPFAEYFEQLLMGDPPSGQLPLDGVQVAVLDPPIDESSPSLTEVKKAVSKMKVGKAAGLCNISAEFLKVGGSGRPYLEGERNRQDYNNYRGITLLSVPCKVFSHALLIRVRSHLLKFQRPEQSGFTPGARPGCVLAPTLFCTCMDWVLDVIDQCRCGVSIGNTKVTDLVFPNDATLLVESLEVLIVALESLHREARTLGLEISWNQDKGSGVWGAYLMT
ncbi:uncharacterized protein LOC143033154 [Oratosquilla oratoria]|uniref:uncharacterized protein LOC143033154 n=1 Tax=Oratosquilla oratoria TaxID=337810 RepID=UPI003F76F29F